MCQKCGAMYVYVGKLWWFEKPMGVCEGARLCGDERMFGVKYFLSAEV